MGSRRPDTARSTLKLGKMKLLSELLSLSSWNSTTGSLDLGKKDFHAKYTVKEQLGKGGFGVVYSAVRRSDGLEVAVKEVSKDEKEMLGSDNMHLEVALMQQLQEGPGEIKLLDYFEMNHCYFIVMERFHCKDLFDFISEQGPLPESLAKDLFKQILETIVDCHKRGIVHWDIKDENILINLKNKSDRLWFRRLHRRQDVPQVSRHPSLLPPRVDQLKSLQAGGSDRLVLGHPPLRHGVWRRPL